MNCEFLYIFLFTCALISISGSLAAVAQDNPPFEQWNKTLGGKRVGTVFSMEQTLDGGYILGCNQWMAYGNLDVWLIRVDANGTELWNKTYGGDSFDGGASFLQTSDSGY